MNKTNRIPWPRIAAEAIAIVASILLAFTIDAWWQDRSERREAGTLVAGLVADFESSQAHLEIWLAGNRRLQESLQAFVDAVRGAPDGEPIAVAHAWLFAAVATPTYSPTDSTLLAAVSSGKIELLDDAELRNLLSRWRTLLDDTREDEILIRQIVVGDIVPALSGQLGLGAAFEYEGMLDWFQSGVVGDHAYRLSASPRIESVLAERLFFTRFVVAGLGELGAVQKEILARLRAYPDGDRS